MTRNFFLFILFLLMLSCKESEARKPKQHSTTNFYKELIEKNRRLVNLEKRKIEYFLKLDTIRNYQESSTGFWYTYEKKDIISQKRPEVGDIVTIDYIIKNMSDAVIYPNQQREYKIDKEDFIPALQDGIKLMKKGETITFVIPSYRGFGVAGDGNKINGNQTIKSTVTLIDIQTN